ncbi:MAG: PRC-barrel domain-containing protein [Anaerolineae bacterium]|nr:PRC-barrel domain-containing protein [Anaerolineae bacterium]
MEFIKDAPVLTAENEQIGHVERIVIDPKTKVVTHIVIRKGFIFAENKVLPISLVASGGEQVKLRENVGDLQAFPKFEEKNYVIC